MTPSSHILVIDDDSDILDFVSAAAEALGLRCVTTPDAKELPDLLTPDVSLILLDLMMPEMDGIEILRMLGARQCNAGIVLMSGIAARVIETAEKLAATLGLSVLGHLNKPFRLAELEHVLQGHAPDHPPARAPVHTTIPVTDKELRQAVERNEFILYYQPQIEIATGSLLGLEALARWQHPDRGLIPPDSFIGRLEAMGLIEDFGWLVVDRGLAEIKKFALDDGTVPRLSLNVSVHSLRDLKFPDAFVSLTRKHGIPPENVVVEITETGIIKEMAHTLDILTRLRVKKIQLSIDDFGTGYAVMQQLRNVPASELKIDKSFVQNMLTNASDRVMVQKTIEIGHELGMTTLAEGVETQAQFDFLRQKGCDYAQGYLFSRPLPPTEIGAWLRQHRTWHER